MKTPLLQRRLYAKNWLSFIAGSRISAKKVRRDFQGLVLGKQWLSLGRAETLPPLHIGVDQLLSLQILGEEAER